MTSAAAAAGHGAAEPAPSPFHEGEARIQTRLGVRDQIEPWARKVVRPFLPDEHRGFFSQLPFLVVAARDETDRPWATMIVGEPGFVAAARHILAVDASPVPGDALDGAFGEGSDVGVLGIELHSRRRNRVNGRVARSDDGGFDLGVEQSFGNCPQYIHERGWRRVERRPTSSARRHRSLPPHLQRFIARADTFFIASGHRGEGENPAYGMDASHRGGDRGFVRVVGGRTLLFPDYAGNNHFNTLGNLMMDPRVGLLFVDFERGDTVQLTGTATVEWDGVELEEFPGARRLVRFELDEAVELSGALPLRFDDVSTAARPLRVVARERESDDVTSFVLEPRDWGRLDGFVAGQYLPVEIELPGLSAPAVRTYSLSNAPGDRSYRITVKRDERGLVSRHLHDRIEVGDVVHARPPRGEFTLDHDSTGPVMLVSAGVGVTPMVSMLHELVARGSSRPIRFVHGARDGRHLPLIEEARRVARDAPDATVHVTCSRPLPGELDDDRQRGRVDGALLARLAPALDADVYMCGPAAFMADVQQQLEGLGFAPDRIFTESFGPAG